ncbi:MAG: DUF4342 domain-containing protein [Clostridia bacterium]|nr:DUF4342 domain-containing protein [Clostridia bacterium]
MNITIELIDEMRKRTNCSYQEAKELLEKHNGDLIEAIIEFEKSQPAHTRHFHHHHKHSSFCSTIKKLFQKSSVTRFIVEKNGETYLNVPIIFLALLVLITIPFFWFYILLVAGLYIMGYKIRIKKVTGQTVEINEIMDDLSNKVKTAAEKMKEDPESQTQEQKTAAKKEDDGENEIIIQ